LNSFIIFSHIEEQETLKKRSIDQTSRTIVGKYARYADIQSYILGVVSTNPDIASTYVTGQTHEKRNLRVLVLATPTSKKSIWIDCGIHAVSFVLRLYTSFILFVVILIFLNKREWVSPATCIWITDRVS